MAKKKAELQADRDAYDAALRLVRAELSADRLTVAVRSAVQGLAFVDGMMAYRRQYDDVDFRSVELIDVILRYAPLVFDARSLAALDETLRTQKRIDRHASDDLAARLETARADLRRNHTLWNHLERHPDSRQDELRRRLGGDQDDWRWTCETWEKLGLLRRSPAGASYTLALVTRTGAVVSAKCPGCGGVELAPKAMFYDRIDCPTCRETQAFVLLNEFGQEPA